MEGLFKLTGEEKKLCGTSKDASAGMIADKITSFCCRDKCHAWASRRLRIVETLYRSRSDIICLQEVQGSSRELADIEYEKEDIMIVHAKTEADSVKAATKSADKTTIDAVEIALKKCTDWLFRYKKQSVITEILKEMSIYDSVRGTQCITMKMCDIFELSASSIDWLGDDAQALPPGNISERMLRNFGLRGQEPQLFLAKLTSRAMDWSKSLKKSEKLAEIIKILDEMETIKSDSSRPWNMPISISQLVDYFHICDDDLDDLDWCCLQLRLSPEETSDFKRRHQGYADEITNSIAEACAWQQSLDSKMKQKRFGHPGHGLVHDIAHSPVVCDSAYQGFGKSKKVLTLENGGTITPNQRECWQRISKQSY